MNNNIYTHQTNQTWSLKIYQRQISQNFFFKKWKYSLILIWKRIFPSGGVKYSCKVFINIFGTVDMFSPKQHMCASCFLCNKCIFSQTLPLFLLIVVVANPWHLAELDQMYDIAHSQKVNDQKRPFQKILFRKSK